MSDNNKIFVGGLAWATDDQGLMAAFEAFGNVTEAKVITDRMTGRSRGFGFVTFDTDEAATEALAFDGQMLDGRTVRVDKANRRAER
ncbi:MAG: RNA-binding protein [Pseudomonadota bacterium]